LNDSSKYDKKHVFEVIGSLMANGQLSEKELELVRKTTMKKLEQLIEVNKQPGGCNDDYLQINFTMPSPLVFRLRPLSSILTFLNERKSFN
jgi:hypothetical protein